MALRRLREWTAEVPLAPDAAWASLLGSVAGDPYVAVTLRDDARRELHAEGQGWFHGEWRVEPAGPAGSRVTQRVHSKAAGLMRAVWLIPERVGLRHAERNFRQSVARMTGP